MSRPQLCGGDRGRWILAMHLASSDRAQTIADAVAADDQGMAVADFDSIGDIADETVIVAVFDDASPDWLATIAEVVVSHPAIRPVLLVHVDRPALFLGAMMAGVVGFCDADASIGAIVRTINSVRCSGVAIPRTMVPPLVAHLRGGHRYHVQTSNGTVAITNREWQILVFLMQRRTTSEMADALYVSPGTVRSHVSALLRKIGAGDRDDAIQQIATGQLELLDRPTATH